MRVTGDWLDRVETQTVCALLTGAGHRALLVGGCVRNALLGQPVADVDIATDALPAVVMALARAAGLPALPTGMDHGTVTVLSGGLPHEVTTFRRDLKTDGRHAEVSFTATLAEDAARRDFTMNALYADPAGTVIDPLNGLGDLVARRVRFVGAPAARIAEDSLRILRFFRFHAWYGDPAGGLDAEGLAACAALADRLEPLSRERVGAEIAKLLAAPDPAPSVAAMAQSGILARVLPGAVASALAPLVHLEAGAPPDWLLRLAILGGPDPTSALRLSRQAARDWALLRALLQSDDGAAALAWRHGIHRVRQASLLRAALMGTQLPDDLEAALAQGAAAIFPVQAADLMPEFTGAALGQELARLEARWIKSGFTLSRAQLLGA